MTARTPLLAAALAATALAGCSSMDSTRGPAAPARPAYQPVDPTTLTYPDLPPPAVPQVRRVELSNGIVVLLAEDRSLPLVSAQARVGIGSLMEPADHAGLASIAATTLRSGGAGTFDADALNLALDDLGASVEAFSGDDATIVAMRTLSDNVDAVLPLFAAVLTRPRFANDKVSLAKVQQKSAISRRNDDPAGIAQRELFQAIYGEDNPYARDTEYHTIDAIGRDDVVEWHRAHFVPADTRLAIWGDFDADQMVQKLEAALGAWTTPAGFQPTPVPAPGGDYGREILFVQRDDVNQSRINIGHPGEVRFDSPDYPALLVMNEVLGGGFASRLFRTLRTDLGLTYGAGGSYSARYLFPGTFYSLTFTKSETTTEALRAMLDVIRSMSTTPPTAQELSLSKESYLNSFVFNFDTKSEVLGRQLTYDTYGYPSDFLQTLKDRVEAVTAADVQRVAQQYLRLDDAKIIVVGNAADFDEPLTALGPVREVDIAIPLAAPGSAAGPAGDAAAGAAGLSSVLNALGGADAFAAVTAIRAVGQSKVKTPQGEIEIGTTRTTRLPNAFRIEQQTPFGLITYLSDGDTMTILTPAGPQAAPPGLMEQLRTQLFLSLPYLLARAGDLTAEGLPNEGTQRRFQVRAPGVSSPIVLTLDEAGRPVRIETTQITQAGPATVGFTMTDYRSVGDLVLPFRYIETTNGEVTGEAQLSALEINPTLGADAFSAGN